MIDARHMLQNDTDPKGESRVDTGIREAFLSNANDRNHALSFPLPGRLR